MLIVLEGADKTGKSTLAEELRKNLKWPVVHFGKPGINPAQEYAEFLLDIMEKDMDVICDRFFVGELVYGMLLRGKDSMSKLQFVTIERLCRLNFAALIYVNTKYKIVEKRYDKLGDELISKVQNKKAHEMFKSICPNINFHINYEWDGIGDVKKIAEKLATEIIAFKLTEAVTKKWCTGTGTVSGPKIVFVGDRINKNTTWLNLPFDNGPTAEYLLSAMELAGVVERHVYITNADTITAREIDILIKFGQARFISLGKKADEKLKLFGINHAAIPHPRYWKRFHSDDKAGYATQIKLAIREAKIYNVLDSFKQYC